MLTNYYTLQALVRTWALDLVGCVVGDAYSQARDELTLALARPDAEWMLRLSVQAPRHYLFRAEGYNRARRNVATLFEPAFGRTVTGLRVAATDAASGPSGCAGCRAGRGCRSRRRLSGITATSSSR